jgi:FAD/FMN-containing dehydrogenase
MHAHESWGRFIPSTPARVVALDWVSEIAPLETIDGPLLAYGMGRSYGDVCLNNGATLLDTARLSRFRSFDCDRGILECEAGATLDDILRLIVPQGWFLPVTPGTKFVTIGGCIANDVHGKNHHRAGTFGRWVRSFELLRSDGLHRCSESENRELFEATIGGLGLTGLIVSAEIQLCRIESPLMTTEAVQFRSLPEFQQISDASDATHEYTVAWFDSLAGRDVRGVFFRGNFCGGQAPLPARSAGQARVPVLHSLSPLLNSLSVRAFNTAYFLAHGNPAPRTQHYDPFFYPLDAIANWNAAYGRKGFVQYQFLIPPDAGLDPVAEILDRTARSRMASFLTVIKKFGDLTSPGMLSFPRPGMTVCLDFAAKHRQLLPLLEAFDDIVGGAGGSVYPAKDARLSPERFRAFFPRWRHFSDYVDPRFSSSFWRRVTA